MDGDVAVYAPNMNNVELIELSSDDEAVVAREAVDREAVAREAAARQRSREAAARRPVAIRGPNKKGGETYDKYCVFANRVALDRSQVTYLKKFARKRPTIPVYVCTIQDANVIDAKAKMYFERKYSNANIKKYLEFLAKVKVYVEKELCAEVRMIMGKGKGKGAQITSGWKKVVEKTEMDISDIFGFWFHRSSKDGLKLIVEEIM